MNDRYISEHFSYIYDNFYRREAMDRFFSIMKYGSFFLEEYARQLDGEYFYAIDPIKARAVVDSYFLDVIRFKEYHFRAKNSCFISRCENNKYCAEDKEGYFNQDIYEYYREIHETKKISPAKVASFTLKWILKHDPVILYPKYDDVYKFFNERDLDAYLSVNPAFGFAFSLHLMGIGINSIPKQFDFLHKSIKYHLLYRSYDERHFFIIFDIIHKIAGGGDGK